jgi:hypothetical protein
MNIPPPPPPTPAHLFISNATHPLSCSHYQVPHQDGTDYPRSDLDALFDDSVYFAFDLIIGVMIMIELMVRFAVAKTYFIPERDPSDPNHHSDFKMQPFFKDVTVLVDVVSILPTLLYFHYGDLARTVHDSRLNALKSVRVFRVMRLFRNSPSGAWRERFSFARATKYCCNGAHRPCHNQDYNHELCHPCFVNNYLPPFLPTPSSSVDRDVYDS